MPEPTVETAHGIGPPPSTGRPTVADAMHSGILTCDGEATLTDVARVMSTHHVHCVVVERAATGDADETTWGIISDVDLLRAALQDDVPEAAGEVARRPVSLETTTSVRDAAEAMLSEGSNHAVVLDPETRLPVGIVSTLDVAGVLARGQM